MSCIYKGKVIESELSQNARGGTEMMRDRLVQNVPSELLEKFAIHLSRPRELYDDVMNILYCHDLASDPENKILKDDGWKKFDYFVFVSQWQRDQYVLFYRIPYSKCIVIPNAIEKDYQPITKDMETIRFIYHTTPHRGLELVVPIFEALTKQHENIHLDVYSSFSIYGWEQRDQPYKDLFKRIEDHPNMTYHGAKDNQTVLDALDKSHIFMYPCIWQETSCIAMIEAIRSGVICVHPNYGALMETAGDASVSYDYTENVNDHANRILIAVDSLLNIMKQDEEAFYKYTHNHRYILPRNSINSFTKSWTGLLKALSDG